MSNWFDAYLQETEHIRDNYNQARALFGCPVDGTEPAKIAGIPYRMFTSQGQFKLFESAPADWRKKAHCQWKSVIVDLDDIYFFAKEGELTTNITASGGYRSGYHWRHPCWQRRSNHSQPQRNEGRDNDNRYPQNRPVLQRWTAYICTGRLRSTNEADSR